MALKNLRKKKEELKEMKNSEEAKEKILKIQKK